MSFSCKKKEVLYRGGIVKFDLPNHWIEEYEEAGGGTFYEPGEDTGTLRLNVLSFLVPNDVPIEYPLNILKMRSEKYFGSVEPLIDNRYLLKYSLNRFEDGEELVIFVWEVARMVSPRDYNIAVFSFTVTKHQAGLMPTTQELSYIEAEVRRVRFWIHEGLYEK